METSLQIQLIFLFWQIGFVDTLTLIKFSLNVGAQYAAIVLTSAGANFSDVGPEVLIEPVLGLSTSVEFIRAAKTIAERRARIACLASFLGTSCASALREDPATNTAVGTAIGAKIAHMRAILARGGGTQKILESKFLVKDYVIIVNSVKTPVLDIHPYREKFTENSKIIIDNMFQEHAARRSIQFQEHAARRSIQGCTYQKFKTIAPTCLVPIASTQMSTSLLIGWTCFGVGVVCFITLSALYVFKRAELLRYESTNHKVIKFI